MSGNVGIVWVGNDVRGDIGTHKGELTIVLGEDAPPARYAQLPGPVIQYGDRVTLFFDGTETMRRTAAALDAFLEAVDDHVSSTN